MNVWASAILHGYSVLHSISQMISAHVESIRPVVSRRFMMHIVNATQSSLAVGRSAFGAISSALVTLAPSGWAVVLYHVMWC